MPSEGQSKNRCLSCLSTELGAVTSAVMMGYSLSVRHPSRVFLAYTVWSTCGYTPVVLLLLEQNLFGFGRVGHFQQPDDNIQVSSEVLSVEVVYRRAIM